MSDSSAIPDLCFKVKRDGLEVRVEAASTGLFIYARVVAKHAPQVDLWMGAIRGDVPSSDDFEKLIGRAIAAYRGLQATVDALSQVPKR